ncbi:MAG TPA: hypothetical protein VH879_02320 [Gemmatimonadales bacterium]|jgi:hypothetical protein
MRLHNAWAGLLLLTVACGSEAAGPDSKRISTAGGEQASLQGRVMGLTAGPDSTLVEVAGASVSLARIGSLPVDPPPDDPPPPIPGDTMLTVRSFGPGFLLDQDTIGSPPEPPGGEPPPPPPSVVGCGRTGDVVAEPVAGGDGGFQVTGVEQGLYDLHVSAPDGSPFGDSYYCGLELRSGQPAEINIYLPLRGD